ncbi:MAG: protein kinase [Baekduia sp.]
MSVPVGTLLSERFKLERKIGTGGMSTVYVAMDTVLERRVAIKLMHREITADSAALERFRREARAVAKLNHPHIVSVIDAGEDADDRGHIRPYIVFEYVEGETLKQRIRRMGRLPVTESVAYAIEIARALGAAHAAGIVHRDVKPQNVLLDRDGTAKVTDFGIARVLDQDGLTADGRVLGTTDYVSPEQALGHAVSGQSDLYSLGIVLYEMLAGEVPFRGDNQVQVAMRHVREELPDIRVARPEVSAALAAVLEHLTAKDVAARYADDRALIADLEQLLTVESQRSGQLEGEATAVFATLPAAERRRFERGGRGRVVLGVLVALVALAGAGWFAYDNIERGTGQRSSTGATSAGLEALSLGQDRVRDYDPGGDGQEHRADVRAVLDDVESTTWSTERYANPFDRTKTTDPPGVGIYLDAKPGVAAKALEIKTPTPGWAGRVYAARGEKAPADLGGWTDLDAAIEVGTDSTIRVPLDTGGVPYRFYLIWITELSRDSPVQEATAEIAEARLLVPRS